MKAASKTPDRFTKPASIRRVRILICRVEGISASSTRVALALARGCILAVTRTSVLSPGRARAVVPPGGDASGSAAAAGRDQVAGGQPGGPADGLHGGLEQQPRRLVFPGAPGRRGMKAPVMVPGQLLTGTGRDDPARRRRLPVRSREHGASPTLERLFTGPRRP